MSRADRFLKACRLESVDAVPVWLMRQAGRYMQEYRDIRGRHSFLELCKRPSLAVEVMLQPLDAFELDAAILFSDILVLVEAMGIEVRYEERQGPILPDPPRTPEALRSLRAPDPEEDLGFVLEAIRLGREALAGRVPLIGFAGAPFTLATYILEGGSPRDFLSTKKLMYQLPDAFGSLMMTLTEAVASFLRAQAEAGAQALQIFDTWAVALAPADYERYVLAHMQRLVEEVRSAADVPIIYFSLGASTLAGLLKLVGADVISFDWKIDLGEARTLLGPRIAVQGNLDPLALFQPREVLERTVRLIVEKAGRWPGYIFNLGHGIHPSTPVDRVAFLVETVHSCLPCARREGGAG
jgi:uroporphyrinogen decarboxylase